LVYAGGSAYSCLAELPLGRIGLAYERDNMQTISFYSMQLKP
jgi:hypothetical protein